MKRKYIILLLLCGIRFASQAQTAQVGDTIFLTEERLSYHLMEEPLTIVHDSIATHLGIVKSVSDSVANLQIFRIKNATKELPTPLMVGTRRVIADSLAQHQLLLIGRQVDFYPGTPPRVKMGRVYNTQHLLVSGTMHDPNGRVFRKGFVQDGRYIEQQFYDNDTLRLVRRFYENDQRFDRNGLPATEEQVKGDLWAFDDGVRVAISQPPTFGNGNEDLIKYLSNHVKYPAKCREKKIEGRSVVKFTIDTIGQVVDVSILQSSGDTYLDKEAVRVVSKMPKWNAGYRDGKKVRVSHTLPVNFRLEENRARQSSIADWQEGDTLWVEKVIVKNPADIPYTTKNQRDPHPWFNWTICEQANADHYALCRRQDEHYILSISSISSSEILKTESYTLRQNGSAQLDGDMDYYRNGQVVYREHYLNGQRQKAEWLNHEGNVYKRAFYKNKKLSLIQSVNPATNQVWKQKRFVHDEHSEIYPDTVLTSYFSDQRIEIDGETLPYQPPRISQPNISEDELSRLISRHFVIEPYFLYVAMYKFSGKVLVDETGAIAAFADGDRDLECAIKNNIMDLDRIRNIEFIHDDMLEKIREYVHFQPAKKGDKLDIGEAPLSFCYSPLYYAANGDTLYCSTYEESVNKKGERTKVNLCNTRKQSAPYYAIVKRTDQQIDLDFYQTDSHAIIKRAHYVCVAPDSILPDGVVDFQVANNWVAVKKYDKGLEYDNWFLNSLKVGDALPVSRTSAYLAQRKDDEIIGVSSAQYTLIPRQSPYLLIVQSQIGDTVEVTYQDTITRGKVETERYVRANDNHYQRIEQLVRVNDSVSILTEFVTDTTQIRSVFDEKHIIHSRFYVKKKDNQASWLEKTGLVEVCLLWKEKYDATGNIRFRQVYERNDSTDTEELSALEIFYPSGETSMTYSFLTHLTEHFDTAGDVIDGELYIPKKTENALKKYVQSYKTHLKQSAIVTYTIEDLYVAFRLSANGEIEFLDTKSTDNITFDSKDINKIGEERLIFKEEFKNHLNNVSNANLTLEPCSMNGKPIDNIVVIYIKKMQKNIQL